MKKLSSIQIFKDKQIENLSNVIGGQDIWVSRTDCNGWHTRGTSTDNGDGTWDWKDAGSGWQSDHEKLAGGCSDNSPGCA